MYSISDNRYPSISVNKSSTIFSDRELLDHLNDEVPVIMRIPARIKEFENCTFLPEPVKNLFESMLELLSKMQKLAAERFVKSGIFDAKEPPNEYLPSLPIHSEKKISRPTMIRITKLKKKKNHTGCSEFYNSDRYNYLKNVNTQICEQKNRSLRKLSSTLAYCSFKNYQNKVKLFFIMNNYEEKGNL